MGKSPAKIMQEVTEKPENERRMNVCLRTDNGYEYHMSMAESAALALIDPDVDDVHIEVPVPADQKAVKHRFVHTSRFKEIDFLDEFTPVEEGAPNTPKRVG